MTFLAGEASPTTNVVVSFAKPVHLAGGNASFRVALWGRAEVLCGKNTVIRKGLQIGHNDCPNAGLDKLRGKHEDEPSLHFGDQLFVVDDIREVLAEALEKSKPDKSPMSIWCYLQDRLVWINRRQVSSI